MTDQREQILARIRQNSANNGNPLEVRHHLESHQMNLRPVRAQTRGTNRLTMFEQMLTAVGGHCEVIPDLKSVVEKILSFIGSPGGNAFQFCITGEIEALKLDWPSGLTTAWQAKESYQYTLSLAYGAVAETGTSVVVSSAGNPVSQNLLGDHHFLLLPLSRLWAGYEDVWEMLRHEYGEKLPRDITLISGPSCTGDIEMVIENGAHGPRELTVLVIESL